MSGAPDPTEQAGSRCVSRSQLWLVFREFYFAILSMDLVLCSAMDGISYSMQWLAGKSSELAKLLSLLRISSKSE